MDKPEMTGTVAAVCISAEHKFSKQQVPVIRLVAGLGIEGDAHQGVTVKHLFRVKQDPTQPNLRQVHLIHEELLDELRAAGFAVSAGSIGENLTTRGIDLLALPTATRLHIGNSAVLEVTGLRNPCHQLDNFQKGLTAAVLDRDTEGKLVRKSGIMAIVLVGGDVTSGDAIRVELPVEPHHALVPV